MKRTTRIFIAVALLVCTAGLVVIDQLYPNLEQELENAQHALMVDVNPSDSLIADETYVCTDAETGLGFTFNLEIAKLIDAQDGCDLVAIDGDYHWFTYDNEIPKL